LKERGYPTISKAVHGALEKLLGIPQEIPYRDARIPRIKGKN